MSSANAHRLAFPKTKSGWLAGVTRWIVRVRGDLWRLVGWVLMGLFPPRAALEAENLVLRHQLNVLRRKAPKRVALSSIDRLLLVGLYRIAPEVLDALKIITTQARSSA